MIEDSKRYHIVDVRLFDRNKEIKRVLFNIFRNEEGQVQIAPYLSAINLDAIQKIRALKRGE